MCEVLWFMCNNTFMRIYLSINNCFLLLTPILIINYCLIEISHLIQIVLFHVIVFLHFLITAVLYVLVLLLIIVHLIISIKMLINVLSSIHLLIEAISWCLIDNSLSSVRLINIIPITLITIINFHCTVESLKYHIAVFTLHKTLIHILHYTRWMWFYNTYVMDTTTWNLNNLSV